MYLQFLFCSTLSCLAPETRHIYVPASHTIVSATIPVQSSNTIGGHVFDKQRRPLAQLIVELLNDLGSTVAQTRTSNSGRYEFSGLRQGRYQIRVLTYGTDYVSQTREEDVVSFNRGITNTGALLSGGQYIQADFVLVLPKADMSRGTPGVVFVQQVPDDARKFYDQAVSDLDSSRTDQGVSKLQNAVAAFPDYFSALERLGIELVKRQEYAPAVGFLERAVRINARGYQSYYWLGLAQHHSKQSAAALASFKRAVSLNATSINAQMWLGIVLWHSGDYAQAETHLKQAKELGKNRVPDAHWHLALLYNKTGRNEEAADELELFLKAQPDSRDSENIKRLIKSLRDKARSGSAVKR